MELKVTLVQPDLVWENKTANRAKILSMIRDQEPSDLILLPEMFSTGFSMNVEKLAEKMEGPTVEWMKETAARLNVSVAGSLIIKEQTSFYNRLIFLSPDQNTEWYDKRHLFTMGEEHLHFTPGIRRVTSCLKGWKIRLQICYDLRFPVWSRNDDEYDILLYAANWPSARHPVWKNLLVARALENQCYCIGVNRIGEDGMGIRYHGDSAFVTPKGVATWLGNNESVKTFTLSKEELQTFRKKFPLLPDRDRFILV